MTKKLVLILVPTVVLLCCCIGALCFINAGSNNKLYMQQIQMADKYLANNDYENAIVYYNKAIKADKTQEKPYLSLAGIYYNQDNLSMAIQILRTGVGASNSTRINNLLAQYLQINGEDNTVTKDKSGLVSGTINNSLIEIFNQYNYEKYTQVYTIESENYSDNKYVVQYSGLNMQFIYYNTDSNKNVINMATQKPNNNSKPNEIAALSLDDIISGASNGVTLEQIKKSGAENVIKTYDKGLNKYYLSFSYNTCSFTIECDNNGYIKGNNAYNKIVPVAAPDENTNKIKISGKVANVTTMKNVSKSELKFRSGENKKSGNTVEDYKSDDGTYTVNLAVGEYTVEVSAGGYNTEYFKLSVTLSNSEIKKDFNISPSLASGEIRIVLEWGSTPHDLDSHLEGTTSTGKNINVDFTNKTATENGNPIAKLDVDDTNSYGPETTTLYNSSGLFKFRVHKFSSDGSLASSGAKVKVYLSGQAQPKIISIPSNVSSDWWDVFTIEDGSIKDINGNVN